MTIFEWSVNAQAMQYQNLISYQDKLLVQKRLLEEQLNSDPEELLNVNMELSLT